MKKIIIRFSVITLLAFSTISCKLSTNDLGNEVKKSMLETWQKEGISGVEIEDLTLTHVNGNEYSGLLETVEDGEHLKRTVKVIYDGENMQWEIVDL